jgi:CubicO group peptidase (beta-lactamase class C family)
MIRPQLLMRMARGPRVAVIALVAIVALCNGAAAQNLAFSLFERYLESLRVQVGIPAVSAAILQDGQTVWERGFGMADLESSIAARPDTPYLVGDLTQVFTTLLLARCAEEARVFRTDPIRQWVPLAPDPPATINQILSHTGGPTGTFKYDPARFALLTAVVEDCRKEPFRRTMGKELLDRFSMLDAIPGRDFAALVVDDEPMFDTIKLQQYVGIVQRLAVPYKVDNKRRATRSELPASYLNASTGLVASVRDLAKFDGALSTLVRPDTLEQLWTNQTVNGVAVPSALGWFSQIYQNEQIVWQFGVVPDSYSALMLKVPTRRLTLILLANSDGLAAPFSLQNGDVTSSLFVQPFLKLFL